MKAIPGISRAIAVLFAAAAVPAWADLSEVATFVRAQSPSDMPIAKAVSTQTLGSRATVTPSATAFCGFEMRAAADVYILVRGNSLGTLGVTQGFLDAPRARLYDSTGADLVFDGNQRGGFNGCVSSASLDAPVVDFYANVRHQAVHDRDSCVAVHLQAGVYTFSVTPSIPGVTTGSTSSSPSSGEMLFEVTLAP